MIYAYIFLQYTPSRRSIKGQVFRFMKYHQPTLLILIVLISCIPVWGYAQPHRVELVSGSGKPSAFEQIDRDLSLGLLDAKQGVTQKLLRLFNPQGSMPIYRELPLGDHPARCATPLLLEARAKGVNMEALLNASARITASPQNDTLWHVSPMKLFRVRYFTTGSNAVPPIDENANGIPDYPEQAALAADSSYRHMVTRLGYKDPFPLKNKPILIVMEQLPAGTYGYVDDFGGANAKIFVRNNYNTPEFLKNTDSNKALGALKVTVAHELKHILQSVVIERYSNPGAWIEMDATLMEEVVYDNVNDYYNYLNSSQSVFRAPAKTVVPGNYYHSSWALYYEERFGTTFWVDVWKEFERQHPNPHQLNAMANIITAKTSTATQELTRNYLWHLASGKFVRKQYGFSEARHYPDLKLDSTIIAQDADIQFDVVNIPPYAGRAYMLDFTKLTKGFLVNEGLSFYLKNNADNLNLGLGLLAFYSDSTATELIPMRSSAQELLLNPKFDYSRVERIGVVVVNAGSTVTGGTISLKRRIQVGIEDRDPTLPKAAILLPNYPNPFNPQTLIPFTLAQAGQIRLEVIDLQGRVLQVLEQGYRKAGRYEHRFDGQALASGVYMVRLVAGQEVQTRKITLLK